MQFDEKSLVTFASLLICFFVVLFASYGYCNSAQDDNEHIKSTGLFRDAAIKNEVDTAREPFIVRSRLVEINFDVLIQKNASNEAKSDIANMLGLNLFDNVYLTAVIDRLELRTIDDFSWIGHIKGIEYSEVIFILKDSVMVGNITTISFHYQLRYVKSGVHTISEIDRSAFLPELEPIPVE